MLLNFAFKHSCLVEFLSTVLTSSVLQKTHQLKDWLPLPCVHLFLALTINSCQWTPPPDSQAPANSSVLASIFSWRTPLHGHAGAFHMYSLLKAAGY